MAQALAIKYRPHSFNDVVEQGSIKTILTQQLETGEWKHAYLFCGGAGTGKTTCARIFAHELNHGQGNPIELDAASNNGVEDVRSIIQQAKSKPLDSEYKVFIIDECHSISNAGWQAFLKIIEEPPKQSIFLFCTTDPQKIPKTILSRVQRYDFQRISQKGIVNRLTEIVVRENSKDYNDPDLRDIGGIRHDKDAIEYIAKIADGGMRDAISLLDKCLAYSNDLTLENIIQALGTVDYDIMIQLTDDIILENFLDMIKVVEDIYNAGKDTKQFVKQYVQFLLDVNKYAVGCDWQYLSLPKLDTYVKWLESKNNEYLDTCWRLLDTVMSLNINLKYSQSPKQDIETTLLLFRGGSYDRAE